MIQVNVRILLALALVCLASGFSAHAQSDVAVISGFVRDPSGAAAPGAAVAAVHSATNARLETRTNEASTY